MLRSTNRTTKTFILTSAVVFAAMSLQFTGPTITNPPATGEFTGPDSITTLFRRACYDCHSNETKLTWYDNIAPISWKISADVRKARSRFNFSHWDSLTGTEQVNKLWYMVNMVDHGKMPLSSYAAVHPEAQLSEKDIATLKNYVVSLSGQKPLSASSTPGAIKTVTKIPSPSLNGITYSSEYRNWKVIASTNRFDNGTLRLIYGNDIAVKALEQNTINPWPNGAQLAKVVWTKGERDPDGNVHAGDFSNVQFMIRDDKRFKDTEGWGFARFSTPELIPYGKTASFATECINCHKLASANGFVFDIPEKRIP